jgi:IS5 family transposase
MYFKEDKQISLYEFGQAAGLKLNPNNRWIKKSDIMDWDKIEGRFAHLYCDNNGARATLIRTALGALIIKQEEGFSDEATLQHIQENPYMKYFCGIKEFSLEMPFVPSLMVEFRKRFNEEVIREINDMMFKPEPLEKKEHSDDDDNTPAHPNGGTLILDATCTPTDITYPQDIILCNESREKTEKMVEVMHKGNVGEFEEPRLDKQKARREYLKTAKGKNRSKKVIRKAIKRQLSFIGRNLGYIKVLITQGNYDLLYNTIFLLSSYY